MIPTSRQREKSARYQAASHLGLINVFAVRTLAHDRQMVWNHNGNDRVCVHATKTVYAKGIASLLDNLKTASP